MTAKIYLDNRGGSFSLYKEKEVATWNEEGPYRSDVEAETFPDDLPAVFAGGFDVRSVRTIMIRIVPSDLSATWSIKVYGGVLVDPEEDRDWDLLDGGDYTNRSGRLLIKVDVVGLDYVHVFVSALSTGTISVNYGLVELDNE